VGKKKTQKPITTIRENLLGKKVIFNGSELFPQVLKNF
jgi:hypothetical protein